MATVDQYLLALQSEIGYTESPPGTNDQKFSRSLGRPAEKWCADLLVAVARRLGLSLPSESASTVVMASAFRKTGRWSTTTPQRGAFVFYDFPDSSTGIQHVGCVESFNATQIISIEGNTSSGNGSPDNGGEVARRTRPRKYVVGYGMPYYGVSSPPTPQPEPPHKEVDMAPLPITVAGDPKVNPTFLYAAVPDPAHNHEIRWRHILSLDTIGHLVQAGLVGAGTAGVHTHEVMPKALVEALYPYGSDLG